MYGNFAYLYDRLMSDTDYDLWCDFYLRAFKKYNTDAKLGLDMGCGTGNITMRLKDKGIDMIGLDISSEMLSVARNKDSKILYLNASMTDFELYGTVDFVISALDCINYITDKRELKKCFKLVNNYLNPKGLFIFDVNTPYKIENILGSNTFAEDKNGIFYSWQSYFDKKSKICEYDLTFFEKQDENFIRTDEKQFQRAYSMEEIEKLIIDSGLEYLGVYNSCFKKAGKTDERWFFIARERGKK